MSIDENLDEWETAPLKKMISYAFGYVVINFLINLGPARLLFFYENEMLMPWILLAIANVVFAIWNMFNDPLLGYYTDKPRKWTRKWGLRAPWVVITAVPTLILFLLFWTPPQVVPATEIITDYMPMFLYFIVITCLFDTFFSVYNEHVYGGFTNQFPSEYERRKAFSIATLILTLVMVSMSVISTLFVEIGNPQSYFTSAIIMVIMLVFCNIILFTGIRESKEMKEMFIKTYEQSEKQGFFYVAKKALTQRNFVISLAGFTISTTCSQLASNSTMYVYNDVYGLPYSMSIIVMLTQMVAFIVVIPFWYNFSRKHGFKKTYWVCYIAQGFTYIPLMFIGGPGWDATTTIIAAAVTAFIMGLFASGGVLTVMPVAADTYDELALIMGRRQDATFVGIRNFFFRVAFLVVGVLIPVIHYFTGYVQTTELMAQTPLATFGVRIHYALIPMILFIVMGLLFKKYYHLEGDIKEELVRKLKEAGLYRQ